MAVVCWVLIDVVTLLLAERCLARVSTGPAVLWLSCWVNSAILRLSTSATISCASTWWTQWTRTATELWAYSLVVSLWNLMIPVFVNIVDNTPFKLRPVLLRYMLLYLPTSMGPVGELELFFLKLRYSSHCLVVGRSFPVIFLSREQHHRLITCAVTAVFVLALSNVHTVSWS